MSDKPVVVDPLELVSLFFDEAGGMGTIETVDRTVLPAVAQRLLNHQHHMTVTVERHHGCSVDLEVLREHFTEESYSREILLRRSTDRVVALYGIVRLRLGALRKSVAARILEKQTPLGRVLIEQKVLRRVQLLELLRIAPGPRLTGLFPPCPENGGDPVCFGRTAMIHVSDRPAIELLEIVPPP